MNGFKQQFTRVKGISDRRRLPRLGKIRLGVKKVSQNTGKEYPAEADYFVLTDAPGVAAVYGDRPKRLDVMIPVEDPEVFFPQSYRWYGAGRGVKCIGDGDTATRQNEQTGEFYELGPGSCPCARFERGECVLRAHLLIFLPRVSMQGVYQCDTGSINSIIDINSAIEFIHALIGRVAMVPCTLERVPRETFGGGKRRIHYPIQLRHQLNLKQICAARGGQITDPAFLLPEPEDINPRNDGHRPDVVVEDEREEIAGAPNYRLSTQLLAKVGSRDSGLFREYILDRSRVSGQSPQQLEHIALQNWERVKSKFETWKPQYLEASRGHEYVQEEGALEDDGVPADLPGSGNGRYVMNSELSEKVNPILRDGQVIQDVREFLLLKAPECEISPAQYEGILLRNGRFFDAFWDEFQVWAGAVPEAGEVNVEERCELEKDFEDLAPDDPETPAAIEEDPFGGDDIPF